MPIADPAELFLEELGDVLYAERQIEKALGKLVKQAQDAELSEGFEHHREETREHIGNVQQVFELMGKRARAKKCPGIEGILEEGEEFLKENEGAPERIVDLFLAGAALRVEHYEIAAYTALLAQAERMPEPRIAELLRANLAQEEKMEQAARQVGQRLADAAVAAGAEPARGNGGGLDGDLSDATKDELLEMAKEAGITGASRMRKDELVEALQGQRR
jgi:ferritin-like metal-binding protein YciE